MTFYKFIKYSLIVFLTSTFLSGCGGSLPKISKPKWGKPIEPNAQKRAQQNVIDGKGFSILGSKNKGDGNFLFASANPMWRASLDTLDFISLNNVDYSGGVIITDWYSEGNSDEAIKITIRFLTNEIRSDGINIILHKRTCKNNNCTVKKINNNLINDIKLKILKKASVYKKISDKNAKASKPKKVFKGD